MQPDQTGHRGPERVGPDELNAARVRLLITDALAQLSAEHRAVLWRSHYLGWPLARIAADLQIAEGTVKSRLFLARKQLAEKLQCLANRT